jgi:hypothetical protein
MSDPTAYVTVSPRGVEEIEVLYPPGQRGKAWQFCQDLFPSVRNLDTAVRDEEAPPA